jgi:hypothetical protein
MIVVLLLAAGLSLAAHGSGATSRVSGSLTSLAGLRLLTRGFA